MGAKIENWHRNPNFGDKPPAMQCEFDSGQSPCQV